MVKIFVKKTYSHSKNKEGFVGPFFFSVKGVFLRLKWEKSDFFLFFGISNPYDRSE